MNFHMSLLVHGKREKIDVRPGLPEVTAEYLSIIHCISTTIKIHGLEAPTPLHAFEFFQKR